MILKLAEAWTIIPPCTQQWSYALHYKGYPGSLFSSTLFFSSHCPFKIWGFSLQQWEGIETRLCSSPPWQLSLFPAKWWGTAELWSNKWMSFVQQCNYPLYTWVSGRRGRLENMQWILNLWHFMRAEGSCFSHHNQNTTAEGSIHPYS